MQWSFETNNWRGISCLFIGTLKILTILSSRGGSTAAVDVRVVAVATPPPPPLGWPRYAKMRLWASTNSKRIGKDPQQPLPSFKPGFAPSAARDLKLWSVGYLTVYCMYNVGQLGLASTITLSRPRCLVTISTDVYVCNVTVIAVFA